jgi:hypothetical protein
MPADQIASIDRMLRPARSLRTRPRCCRPPAVAAVTMATFPSRRRSWLAGVIWRNRLPCGRAGVRRSWWCGDRTDCACHGCVAISTSGRSARLGDLAARSQVPCKRALLAAPRHRCTTAHIAHVPSPASKRLPRPRGTPVCPRLTTIFAPAPLTALAGPSARSVQCRPGPRRSGSRPGGLPMPFCPRCSG